MNEQYMIMGKKAELGWMQRSFEETGFKNQRGKREFQSTRKQYHQKMRGCAGPGG